jgi:hypothetical protein
MRISKVADIVQGDIVPTVKGQAFAELATILTGLPEVADPNSDFRWELGLVIGKGPAAHSVTVRLATIISNRDSLAAPLLLADGRLVYFRNRLFRTERPPVTPAEHEGVILRVKKTVYDEDSEVGALRAAVANFEAATEFALSGIRREGDVPLTVEI